MDAGNNHDGILKRKKKKRKRTVIAPEEIDRLENLFKKEPRPDRFAKMELAKEMGKTENFISIWFQNRRAREKKNNRLENTNSTTSLCKPDNDNVTDAIKPPTNLEKKLTDEHSELVKALKATPKKKTRLSETCSIVRSPLFGRMLRMAAVSEGGILSTDCPDLPQAVTDACRGIRLKDGRLVYNPVYGFEIEGTF